MFHFVPLADGTVMKGFSEVM